MNPDSGRLFVIGGAEDRRHDKLILRRFVEAAGGSAARILVIATASSQPDDVLSEYDMAFHE